MKRLVLTTLSAIITMVTFAQSGTNSPYSQYGLGTLAEQSNGFNRGMNGVGIAFRDHDNINFLNPASYSGIDSLTFIFDAGLSLQVTNFSENGVKKNANNADFEYAMGAFRVMRHLGLGFGIVPFSNVGYNYTSTTDLTKDDGSSFDPTNSGSTYTNTKTFSGSGGLHQGFIGLGWEPIKNFSIGFNASYFWGSVSKTVAASYSLSGANTLTKQYDYSVSNYIFELGAQYSYDLNKKDRLTIGATYRPGHDLSSDPELSIISSDTTKFVAENAFTLPTRISIGLGYNHNTKWRAGLDYTYTKWSSCKYPYASESYSTIEGSTTPVTTYSYNATKGLYKDSHKINLGGEYCQDDKGRSFVSRIHYRLGVSYTTPYLLIWNQEAKALYDGPKETSVSFGFGFPIVNGYLSSQKRYPVVNISAQWAHLSMPNAITENTFRINVGITFKERWFAKWKFE